MGRVTPVAILFKIETNFRSVAAGHFWMLELGSGDTM